MKVRSDEGHTAVRITPLSKKQRNRSRDGHDREVASFSR